MNDLNYAANKGPKHDTQFALHSIRQLIGQGGRRGIQPVRDPLPEPDLLEALPEDLLEPVAGKVSGQRHGERDVPADAHG